MSRRQLRESGLGNDTIARWVRQRRLRRLHPGVYALGHTILLRHGRLAAALLYVGPGAALSHTTAAEHWGLLRTRDGRPAEAPARPGTAQLGAPVDIHVSARGRHRSRPGIIAHRSDRLDPVRWDGLPVVPVAQALREAATIITFSRLRRAIAEAEYLRLLHPAAVEAELGRGRSGAATLRRAWEVHQPRLARTRSELEARFLELCEKGGVPLPQLNVMIGRYTVDALWQRERVVVELDSVLAHQAPSRIERDLARDLDLRRAGYAVLRYGWRQVTRRGVAVLADISRALDRENRELSRGGRS